jgi:hypothetical protein
MKPINAEREVAYEVLATVVPGGNHGLGDEEDVFHAIASARALTGTSGPQNRTRPGDCEWIGLA